MQITRQSKTQRCCRPYSINSMKRLLIVIAIVYLFFILSMMMHYYNGSKKNSLGVRRRYTEKTMPPQTSSVDSAGFIHIGKTGGSIISTLLRNGCSSFNSGPCRNVTHETAVSKLVEHYYHVADFHRLPDTKHKIFIISIRDPFDRTVSALLYTHPKNAAVYKLKQTKRQKHFGGKAYRCFPTLEAFAQLMNGTSTECNYPYEQSQLVNTDCSALACAAIHGKARFYNHLFFNYRNILETKLPTTPPRQLYVLRKEFLWSDWKDLNVIFGQKDPVIIPTADASESRNISGFVLPVTRDISLEGRQKLCLALQSEYMAYFKIIKRAINLNTADVNQMIQIAKQNCANLDISAMMMHAT